VGDATDLALAVLDEIVKGTHSWDRIFGVVRITDYPGEVHTLKQRARAAAKALRAERKTTP